MIIKKIDINSILPIIINIIKLILELVNKLEKSMFSNPYKFELTVFVKANIDNLNEVSKLIVSRISKLDKINKLIKKDINIKNENFIFSLEIFLFELKIDWLIISFGLTNLIISEDTVFNKI